MTNVCINKLDLKGPSESSQPYQIILGYSGVENEYETLVEGLSQDSTTGYISWNKCLSS